MYIWGFLPGSLPVHILVVPNLKDNRPQTTWTSQREDNGVSFDFSGLLAISVI